MFLKNFIVLAGVHMLFGRGASTKKGTQFKCIFIVFCCREMNSTINSLALHRSVLGGHTGTPGCRWVFAWLIFAAFAIWSLV